MRRRSPLLSLCAVVLLSVLVSSTADARVRFERIRRPPNLVLIVGDDHGWPYAGFMGSETVATPNLDALAASGTVLTHMMAPAPNCRPTLQALLGGIDGTTWAQQRAATDLTFGGPTGFRREVVRYQTLPRQLGRRGYSTFQAGKHWEGSSRMAGFDSGTTTLIGDLGEIGSEFGRPSIAPMREFLDGVDDEPFFLWLAPKLPHRPLDPPEELQAPYLAQGLHPDAVLYYANITRLDAVVGRILDELRARDVLRDTLIVYVSDNGWEQAPDRSHFLGPFLGGPRGKASLYELGYRTPTIVSWPGMVPEGRRSDALATFADLHATLLDYGDAPPSLDAPGRSLRRIIEGESEVGRSHVVGLTPLLRVRESEYTPGGAFTATDPAAYVRTPEWRYLRWRNRGEEELYRIRDDPFEENEVAAEFPEVLEELRGIMDADLTARAENAATVEVVGRLRELDGAPVAAMPIQLESFNRPGPAIKMRIPSTADGSFRFPSVPSGIYFLTTPYGQLVHQGQLVERVPVALLGLKTGPHYDLRIFSIPEDRRLHRIGSGTAVVRFTEGWEEPAALLPVQIRGYSRSGPLRRRILTRPDGRAVFEDLPAGIYLIGPMPWGSPGTRLVWLPRGYRVEIHSPLH